MVWTQVTKSWMQLTNVIGTVRHLGARAHRLAEAPVFTNLASDDQYSEPRPTPYLPEGHGQRSESSLHLSC